MAIPLHILAMSEALSEMVVAIRMYSNALILQNWIILVNFDSILNPQVWFCAIRLSKHFCLQLGQIATSDLPPVCPDVWGSNTHGKRNSKNIGMSWILLEVQYLLASALYKRPGGSIDILYIFSNLSPFQHTFTMLIIQRLLLSLLLLFSFSTFIVFASILYQAPALFRNLHSIINSYDDIQVASLALEYWRRCWSSLKSALLLHFYPFLSTKRLWRPTALSTFNINQNEDFFHRRWSLGPQPFLRLCHRIMWSRNQPSQAKR